MELLTAGAKDLQITLKPEHLEAFQIYYRELVSWNNKFNLTAITDYEGIQVRHFLDSVSCLIGLERKTRLAGDRLIDVGTGAGFPGIPIKILRPNIKLTLAEATTKKVKFLEHMVSLLNLKDVTVLNERAETLGQDPAHREQYDWAVARAVAEMPILSEYLLPLVKIGGHILAQKGETAPAEVQRAEWAINQLGGHTRHLQAVELRGLAETRYLVLVDKVAATPPQYCRRPGIPSKRPLLPKE